MGTLTYEQLSAEVTAAMGGGDFSARMPTVLNLAQNRIARIRDWSELQDVSTGTLPYTGVGATDKSFSLPSGTKDIHSFVIQDGASSRKLRSIGWRRFDRIFPLPEFLAPSWPVYYVRWAQKAVLVPVPNKGYAYEIRRSKWPAVFDGTGSALSELDQKDDVLIQLATAYLWDGAGRPDLAEPLRADAFRRLAEAANSDGVRPDLEVSAEPAGRASGPYYADPFVHSVE